MVHTFVLNLSDGWINLTQLIYSQASFQGTWPHFCCITFAHLEERLQLAKFIRLITDTSLTLTNRARICHGCEPTAKLPVNHGELCHSRQCLGISVLFYRSPAEANKTDDDDDVNVDVPDSVQILEGRRFLQLDWGWNSINSACIVLVLPTSFFFF